MSLAFKEFMCLNEDTAQLDKNIIDLQTKISQLETQLSQRTNPIMVQKQRLQQQLAMLQRQRNSVTNAPASPQPSQQQTMVKTPGSAGMETPGQPT